LAAPVLHSDILNTLGAEIAGGSLQAGDVLTLAGLEERFGVSRTVVREAMRILESLGMVSAKRRVGLTVQPPGSWSVLDPQVIAWRLAGAGRAEQLRSLTQLRVALEPTAARLAAQTARHTGPELTTLAARLRELGEQGLGDTPEYLQIDVQFHTLLLTSGGNEMFAALAGSVAEVLTGRTRLGLTPAHPAHAAVENHEELARAIGAGDAAGADGPARAGADAVGAEVGYAGQVGRGAGQVGGEVEPARGVERGGGGAGAGPAPGGGAVRGRAVAGDHAVSPGAAVGG